MATNNEVCSFLRPDGGYIQNGTEYEGIEFLSCEPFTKAEYEAAFPAYDAWKAASDAETARAKAEGEATLIALGLTPEQIKALGL